MSTAGSPASCSAASIRPVEVSVAAGRFSTSTVLDSSSRSRPTDAQTSRRHAAPAPSPTPPSARAAPNTRPVSERSASSACAERQYPLGEPAHRLRLAGQGGEHGRQLGEQLTGGGRFPRDAADRSRAPQTVGPRLQLRSPGDRAVQWCERGAPCRLGFRRCRGPIADRTGERDDPGRQPVGMSSRPAQQRVDVLQPDAERGAVTRAAAEQPRHGVALRRVAADSVIVPVTGSPRSRRRRTRSRNQARSSPPRSLRSRSSGAVRTAPPPRPVVTVSRSRRRPVAERACAARRPTASW